MEPTQPKRTSTSETVRTLGALSTVGLSVVLAIVIGAGLGYFLMTRLGLGIWVFFLCFILGVVAGIINIYRTTSRIFK